MSYGQQICREYLTKMVPSSFLENYRPPWLFGMELDFYYPDHLVAIEFNGDQHYFSTDLAADHKPQQRRDWRKKAICKSRGIRFVSLKAIDLVSCKFKHRFKKILPMMKHSKMNDLDHRAKAYRKKLIADFASPTAHKSKGKKRQDTVARLFAKHPPNEDGIWNSDLFNFKLNQWQKEHGKSAESVDLFQETYAFHIRARHDRLLETIKNASV